jgi:hypothetical protein
VFNNYTLLWGENSVESGLLRSQQDFPSFQTTPASIFVELCVKVCCVERVIKAIMG